MKKNLSLLLISMCMLFSCAKIDPESIKNTDTQSMAKPHRANAEFNKLYGGNSEDYVRAVIQGNNGGYIFTGETYSTGSLDRAPDVWIVKVDEAGNTVWEKTYGGSQVEQAYSLAKFEGGYLVVGRTYSTDGDVPATHGDGDGFVLRIDENGNLLNQKTFGGSDFDEFTNIQPDGNGYILVGNTNSNNSDVTGNHGGGDVWVVKMDRELNIIWQKALGGSQFDGGSSSAISKDGSYIISGNTSSTDGDVTNLKGGIDFWVVKLSNSGRLLWQKTYGGSGFEFPYSLTESVDGGYLITGLTTSSDGDITAVHKGGFIDAWMIKIDKDGDVKWDKSVGGNGNETCAFSMTTHNGDYLIGGNTTSNDGDFTGNNGSSDGWIMRLDKQGKEKWTKVTGGSSGDDVNSACAGNFENYIVAGTSDSNDGDVTGNHGFTDTWLFTVKDK